MKCRELLKIEHPDKVDCDLQGGCLGCPSSYGYMEDFADCSGISVNAIPFEIKAELCTRCWNREVSEDVVKRVMTKLGKDLPKELHPDTGPKVLDSGDRTEFPSGAVRDCRVGKGRCDLMPLDVVAEYIKLRKNDIDYPIILYINEFTETNDLDHLYAALDYFVCRHYDGETYTMLLEVAKQFEEGAKKYGDDNWRKGIPVHCYIDSAIRHYLKYLRGDQDEPHDRAFCWNILCCIWTVKHIENGGENDGKAG